MTNILNTKHKMVKNTVSFSGKTLSKNLSELMKKFKVTSHQLHLNTGVPFSTIKRIKSQGNTNPTIQSLMPLAEFFSVTLNQLLGLEPISEKNLIGTYTENRSLWHNIPLLNWNSATVWPNIEANEDKTISTDLEVSETTFALCITEDNWAGFLPKSIIIVDPKKRPKHNDYIIVHRANTASVSFYQLLIHESKKYLKPPCPYYKTELFDSEYTLKGTLVQLRMDIPS